MFTAEGAQRTSSKMSFQGSRALPTRGRSKPPSKNSFSPGSRPSAPQPRRMTVSRSDRFAAGYPRGLTQGIRSPASRPAAASKASRFMVPPIHTDPNPRDQANSSSCSMANPKATSP